MFFVAPFAQPTFAILNLIRSGFYTLCYLLNSAYISTHSEYFITVVMRVFLFFVSVLEVTTPSARILILVIFNLLSCLRNNKMVLNFSLLCLWRIVFYIFFLIEKNQYLINYFINITDYVRLYQYLFFPCLILSINLFGKPIFLTVVLITIQY